MVVEGGHHIMKALDGNKKTDAAVASGPGGLQEG